MSSNRWKKLHSRKTYRERGQSEDRIHLGILEKKKDYKQRALDFHRKQDAIHSLQVKAAFRNPDEFYHRMERSKKIDGKHSSLEKDLPPSLSETLNLQTSDIAYLRMRRTMEGRKVDALKARLAMARDLNDDELKSKHTVFVDHPDDAAQFDEEDYFDTTHEYISRAFNRPTREAIQDGSQSMIVGDDDLQRSSVPTRGGNGGGIGGGNGSIGANDGGKKRNQSKNSSSSKSSSSSMSSSKSMSSSSKSSLLHSPLLQSSSSKSSLLPSSSASKHSSSLSKSDIQKLERQRSLAYGELSSRMQREDQLDEALDRLQLRHNLQKDSNVVKIKRAGKVVYKWRQQRKR